MRRPKVVCIFCLNDRRPRHLWDTSFPCAFWDYYLLIMPRVSSSFCGHPRFSSDWPRLPHFLCVYPIDEILYLMLIFLIKIVLLLLGLWLIQMVDHLRVMGCSYSLLDHDSQTLLTIRKCILHLILHLDMLDIRDHPLDWLIDVVLLVLVIFYFLFRSCPRWELIWRMDNPCISRRSLDCINFNRMSTSRSLIFRLSELFLGSMQSGMTSFHRLVVAAWWVLKNQLVFGYIDWFLV